MKEIELQWNILLRTVPSEGSLAPGPCVWDHTETPHRSLHLQTP